MREDGCEVWVASIRQFTEHQAALDRVLTPDERAHVQRQHNGGETLRLSRGLLRILLAGYLDLPPDEIEIDRSCPDCDRSHGRPRLRRGAGEGPPTSAIEISVAHGGDLLVLAFGDTAPLGVDIEPIGAPDEAWADLVDFTLTPAERRRLERTPAAQRRGVFLHYWTGKEAALKALGTGLDVHPRAVDLPPLPPGGTASVNLPGSRPVRLWIRDVDVGAGHVCALATGQEIQNLRLNQVAPDVVLDRIGRW